MSQLNDYESGKAAPARLSREYNSIYIHITPNGPITYVQTTFPHGKNWVISVDSTESTTRSVRYAARIKQTSNIAPELIPGCAVPMINTTGAAITYKYNGPGQYQLIADKPIFNECTTFIVMNNNTFKPGANPIKIDGYTEIIHYVENSTTIKILTFNPLKGMGTSFDNDLLNGTISVEIFK